MPRPALAPAAVEAACAGDARAIDELLVVAAPLVLAWCRRLGGPRVVAEDAAQDVLERVLRRMHTLENPARFESWLFGITRRRLADLRRLAWVQRWAPGAVEGMSKPADNPERWAGLSETASHVQAALDTMPIRSREVLVLFHVEGRTAAEIAAMLDLPLGTVKSRLVHARERFHVAAVNQGLVPTLVEVPQ